MSTLDVMLWDVAPYVTVAVLVVGLWWRYRYDKFGWTTRSSQLYESRLLRIGSPLFHFGILVVVIGHVIGLVIPKSWTEAVGVTEGLYHLNAVTLGGVAGVCTLAGVAILVYRRRTTGPVFMATTANDKLMYLVLVLAILTGLSVTLLSAGVVGEQVSYRETVAPWFHSVFRLQPEGELMAGTPLAFQAHTLMGMALFVLWPFTRLVHAFSAPVGYLFRPYVLYRSRGPAPTSGSRAPRRGWERVGS